MHTYLVILRILHIACGVMWAGTAFIMAFYIFPAVNKSGPDGPKMMQAISGTNKFPLMLMIVSTLTLLSGFLLMWQLSAGFNGAWFLSKYGMSLAIGGGAALIAFLQGFAINRPALLRMQAIGAAVAAAGKGPSEQERVELLSIRSRIYFSSLLIAGWLLVAVVTMAGARYF
jgi:hypothetical protein